MIACTKMTIHSVPTMLQRRGYELTLRPAIGGHYGRSLVTLTMASCITGLRSTAASETLRWTPGGGHNATTDTHAHQGGDTGTCLTKERERASVCVSLCVCA